MMKNTYLTVLILTLFAISSIAQSKHQNPFKREHQTQKKIITTTLKSTTNDGSDCSNATIAGGSNTYDGILSQHYYSYTASSDGKITISTDIENQGTYFTKWDNCNWENGETSQVLTFGCIQNQTYIIMVEGQATDWVINESEALVGEVCSKPIVAIKGDNQYAKTPMNYQWYTYTATQDGVLTFGDPDNTAGNYAYYMIAKSCNGDFVNSNSFGCSTTVAKDEIVYLRIADSEQSFNWTLEERAFLAGEDCSTATVITNQGTVDYTGYENDYMTYQWYKYTAKQSGKIIISAQEAELKVSPDCDSEDAYYGYQNLTVFVEEGDVGYIEISYFNGSQWTLTEAPLGDGDICSQPLGLTAGDNYYTSASNQTQWYTYEAVTSGLVKLEFDFANSNPGGGLLQYVDAYMFSECVGALNFEDDAILAAIAGYGNEESALVFEATQGQIYKIAISAGLYDVSNPSAVQVKFTIQEGATVNPGEHCSNPIIAEVDNNTMPVDVATWYKYTAGTSGKTTLSTGENSYYYVMGIYTSCGSEVSLVNDAISSGSVEGNVSLSFNAEQNIEYYIWLENDEGTDGWVITEGGSWGAGEHVSLALDASIGPNTADVSSYSQWFKYTPTESTKMTISSCGANVDTHLSIYSSDLSNLITADDNCGSEETVTLDVIAGEIYYILWGNRYTRTEFEWTLSLDLANNINAEVLNSRSLVYPNPVVGDLFFTHVFEQATIQIYNLSGNLVVNKDISGLDKINVEQLLKGIYLYTINANGKIVSGKIVKR